MNRALIDSLTEKGKSSRAVRDFIEYSSRDADQTWAKSIRFGLLVLKKVSLARLEIKPGIVKGEVVAEGLEQKYLLQQQWASDLPKEIMTNMEIKRRKS